MRDDGSLLIGGPQSGKRVASDCMTLKFPKMKELASFHGESEPHHRSDFDSDVYTKCPIPGVGHIYIHTDYSNVSVFEAILDVIERESFEKSNLLEALNHIASWEEGEVVNSGFDEPESATIARAVISKVTGKLS